MLLLIDVINPFDFDGGQSFAKRALRVAAAIARLRERATNAGVPVIYVNDNLGKWRSDAASLVDHCTRPEMPGAPIVNLLCPRKSDFVVLKSTLSGFYQTPLETMLRLGQVKTLIVTGFAADNCVLFTAADAYMREFRLVVPHDCVGSKTAEARQRALKTMTDLLGATTTSSARLRLSAAIRT